MRALRQIGDWLLRRNNGKLCHRLRARFNARRRLLFEPLETRRVFAAGFAEFIDPNPAPGNQFGHSVVPLATGNVVITSPFDDAGGEDAGAVYLFNGRTGELISTLKGSQTDDHVGSFGVKALTNGNYVVVSPDWDRSTVQNVGAITWGSGVAGIEGVVSSENSLIGSATDDQLGYVVPLTNGNYVAGNRLWDNGQVSNVGAVCWGNGNQGVVGEIDINRCLVGEKTDDLVGVGGIHPLTNGNFVVTSPYWNNNRGAATFGDGTRPLVGAVRVTNSLIGTSASGLVSEFGVTALSNGNYVVSSRSLGGAATWGDGTKGVVGEVSGENSLIGTDANLTPNRVFAFANGNYVVVNSNWNNGIVPMVGAVTFARGDRGLAGPITAENSLIGAFAGDRIGSGGVFGLKNGNYLVRSPYWNTIQLKSRGAYTLGNGITGTYGTVTSNNSLVGPSDNYAMGGAIELANGNFVIESLGFIDIDNDGFDTLASAVTWGDGVTGVTGTISPSNSLVSPVSNLGPWASVTALTNGNYVVANPSWGFVEWARQGAVTWGNGNGGTIGEVSEENSLVGIQGNELGSGGVTALVNGNYVVVSSAWGPRPEERNRGAVTFATGNAPLVGFVSDTNSLIGATPGDAIGAWGVTALPNGNYVVRSPYFTNESWSLAGAATFGSGVSGIHGHVTSLNSLVGAQTGTLVSNGEVISFSNGNYLVVSPGWDDTSFVPDIGAITFGSGTSGIAGRIYFDNSLMGDVAGSGNSLIHFDDVFIDDIHQNFYARFLSDGRVRVGSQIDGLSRPWHLAAKPQDVNNDGHIVAGDVLRVINYINAGNSSDVPTNAKLGKPYGFLDTTGDGNIVAEDVIKIINWINARPPGDEEGEAASLATSPPPAAASATHHHDDALLLLLSSDIIPSKKRSQ